MKIKGSIGLMLVVAMGMFTANVADVSASERGSRPCRSSGRLKKTCQKLTPPEAFIEQKVKPLLGDQKRSDGNKIRELNRYLGTVDRKVSEAGQNRSGDYDGWIEVRSKVEDCIRRLGGTPRRASY